MKDKIRYNTISMPIIANPKKRFEIKRSMNIPLKSQATYEDFCNHVPYKYKKFTILKIPTIMAPTIKSICRVYGLLKFGVENISFFIFAILHLLISNKTNCFNFFVNNSKKQDDFLHRYV